MQPINQSRALVRGTLILTIAALLTKILSAAYRIPFQNIVGDMGFYIYQQVYPLYGVALVLSTTGFPVVISKLYAEQKNQVGERGVQQLIIVATIFLSVLGITAFFLLYFGAEWIAEVMNDPELSILIRVISVVFLIIPVTSLLRGYFQGVGNMVPTAYSQVGEQLIRVGTILITAYLFMRADYSMYEVGAGAVFGSVTGGLIGALILLTFIWLKKDSLAIQLRNVRRIVRYKETVHIVKTLMIQGFAVCVSGMLLLLLQLADSLNLYSMLISTGMNGDDAKVLKGIYDRGQPLVQLGAVVATSMSLSLVPLIAREKLSTSVEVLHEKIELAIRVSMTIGLGATVGLMTIIEPTNIMLFENNDGSRILALLSITIVLSSVIITLIAILQGMGHTLIPAFVVLAGFVAKYGFNYMLVPIYGSMGAAIASNGALGVILLILYFQLRKVIKRPFVSGRFLIKVFSAAFFMFFILKGFIFISDFLYVNGHQRLVATTQALCAVMIGGVFYMIAVIRMKIFTAEELALLPFGSKMMYLIPGQKRS